MAALCALCKGIASFPLLIQAGVQRLKASTANHLRHLLILSGFAKNSCCGLQLGPKAEDVAQKLSRAIKTGRDLQMIEASKEDLAKNQQHQLDHQKKLKVHTQYQA